MMRRRSFIVGTGALACVHREGQPPIDLEPAPHDEELPVSEAGPDPAIPFGMYSAPPDRMHELAAAGFTWAGPFYPRELELSPDRLETAADAGLGALVPIGFHREPIPADPERAIADAVAVHVANDTVAAWYLVPEELSSGVPEQLDYLEVAARTIRAADPSGRPILGYQPNARIARDLKPIARHLDLLAKGTYVNYSGHRVQRAWVRWSVEQMADMSSQPLAALEMFQDPPDASAADIERWVRHDVLLSLLSGARGVLVFSGWRRPDFDRYDDYLAAYMKVVAEVRQPGVASALVHGEPVQLLRAAGPDGANAKVGRQVFRCPSVTARRSGPITVAVNSAPEPVVCRLPGCRGETESGDGTFFERSGLVGLPAHGSVVIRS